jgi:CheY-like chemotaxis protein
VTVRAYLEATDVVVAVTDTGVGIAPEHLMAVFEEFRQVHVFGERRVVGSGLGMAVSKRFVELHGGSMWVESQLGKGSTFSFSLPTCDNVIATVDYLGGRMASAVASARETDAAIVVIDRDGDVGDLFRRHFDGYRVLVAPSAEAARRCADESVVRAAVLVGKTPPDWHVTRRTGEMLGGIPVATCTLRAGKVATGDLGVIECLLKPIGQEQVRRALRTLGRRVRTILVVDDAPEMTRLLARLIGLASRRYTVWEAHGGEEVLRVLATERPDAIFVDLVMPNMGGDELLRRIRGMPGLESIPVVLVTGHGLEENMVTAEFFGFSRIEGFSVRELMRCLRGSLDSVHRPETTLLQHIEQSSLANGLWQEVRSSHS